MNKLVLSVMSLFTVLTVSQAHAYSPVEGTVEACSTDKYTSGRIKEEITPERRLHVFNGKGEVVGAFEFDPADGEVVNLYLCGSNSGQYYAEGNVQKGLEVNIYNDEYDSVTKTTEIPGGFKIEISITWGGEDPMSADYGPVNTVVYVKQ